MTGTLTDSRAWQALRHHHEAVRELHLRDLFAREPGRVEQLTLDAAGITYLGPDRGANDSIYFKDPDGIQIEFIREPLKVMDGRSLGE